MIRILAGLALLVLTTPAFALSNAELLQSFNDTARAAYAAGKAEMLAKKGPVIIVGRDLALLTQGREVHADYTPASYTTQKTISHLALGTIALLEAFADDPAGTADKWRPHLEKLQAQVKAMDPIVGTLGLDEDGVARAKFVLARGSAFIAATLAAGSYSPDGLKAMARDLAPILLASAASAARAQIDMIHAVVQGWRAQMSDDEWKRVRVFVLGPRMPRAANLQFSYFRFALGEDAVDTRLIYAENVFDQPGALSLLGTILTDRTLAKITFDDEMRMDRDLLGDAAEAYLLEIFGKLGRARP